MIARYEYDGLNCRVKAHIDADAPADPDGVDYYRHFYYNASWQILETRKSASENTEPEGLGVEMQYVWGKRGGKGDMLLFLRPLGAPRFGTPPALSEA